MSVRLGIIGGGQLGLYLCEAAQALGMTVTILSETTDAPARNCADSSIVGTLDRGVAVDRLLLDCDVVTFEKEDIPNETLEYLHQARSQGSISVYPDPEILLMLKDKALQKNWLTQQNLPTLPFRILPARVDSVKLLVDEFGDRVVQKARCGGYDGRGVQILRAGELEKHLWHVPSIVEPFLPDCREVSIITARAQSGEIRSYPPVSMEFDFELNSVKTVLMPAVISPDLAAAVVELAERVVTLLNGVGVYAIEMFVTHEDEVLINEISPRVHNSGHITLDACNVSQFEQHVRAVTGMPLVAIDPGVPAAMLNILYTESMREHCPDTSSAVKSSKDQTSVYWYGKPPGITGRKMGHINATASSATEAVELANRAMKKIRGRDSERAA